MLVHRIIAASFLALLIAPSGCIADSTDEPPPTKEVDSKRLSTELGVAEVRLMADGRVLGTLRPEAAAEPIREMVWDPSAEAWPIRVTRLEDGMVQRSIPNMMDEDVSVDTVLDYSIHIMSRAHTPQFSSDEVPYTHGCSCETDLGKECGTPSGTADWRIETCDEDWTCCSPSSFE